MGYYNAKIDAYTAVWSSASLQEITDYYHLTEIMTGFYDDIIPRYTAYVFGTYANISFNGILFQIPSYEWQFQMTGDVEKFIFSQIRVSMMGRALDFLRDLSIPIDDPNNSPLFILNSKCNPTRIDFAFDFINYCTEIDKDPFVLFDNFTHINTNLSESGRLVIKGQKSGVSFKKINGASERTIYIGSPSSDKILRVYDKYLERTVKNNGIFDTSIYPDIDVKDWIRIEWQLRNILAYKYLYAGNFDFKAVLREICEQYDIYPKSRPNGTFKSWLQFFNFDTIMEHLQLLNKTEIYQTNAEKLRKYVDRNIDILLCYCLQNGIDSLVQKIKDRLQTLQKPIADDQSDQLRQVQLYKLTKRLCEISQNNELSGIKYLTIKNNYLMFKTENENEIYIL